MILKNKNIPSFFLLNLSFSDFTLQNSAFKRSMGTFLKSFFQTFFLAKRFYVSCKKLKTFFSKTQNCFARRNFKAVLKKNTFFIFDQKTQTSFLKKWIAVFLQIPKTIFSKKYFVLFRAKVKTFFSSKKFDISVFKNPLKTLETHYFEFCFQRSWDLERKILSFSEFFENKETRFDLTKLSGR